MCGICGIINFKGKPISQNLIQEMNNTLIHRGPDDEGYYFNQQKIANSGQRIGDRPSVALAHRRLSIIDLDTGHQPMSNEDGTVWIVFNGEIYNFIKLREKLIKKGHQFRTKSDTEVIIHAYEEYGTDCLKYLNGMFAFAIWDNKRQVLFLVRDRLGIKPLYYYFDRKQLVFGSEIKAILKALPYFPRIDVQGLWDYFSFRYIPAPLTIFEGIKKLLPGHFMKISNNSFKISQYWDLPHEKDSMMMDQICEYKWIKQFQLLFDNSVHRRLISDVPLGVLLSGGLDSTAVVASLSRNITENLKTFSVAFKEEGPDYDETHYARVVSKHFKTDHYEIKIGFKEFLDALPKYVWYTDEPMSDPASIPLYYVSQLASEHVKVVLSGEGGDELLAGYKYYQVYKGYNRARLVSSLPHCVRKILDLLNREFLKSSRIYRYLRIAEQGLNTYLLHIYTYNVFSEDAKKDLCPNFYQVLSSNRISEYYIKQVLDFDIIDQMLYRDIKVWLPDDLLLKADKMTMANSLELRVPFLDHELAEFTAKLPVSMKVRWDQHSKNYCTKYILRKYLQGKVPQIILERPKRGFPVPLKKWFSKQLKPIYNDILLSSEFLSDGIFNKKFIKNILSGQDSNAFNQAWALLIFAIWKTHFEKETYAL